MPEPSLRVLRRLELLTARRRRAAALAGARFGGRWSLRLALLLLLPVLFGLVPTPTGPAGMVALFLGFLVAGCVGGAARAVDRLGGVDGTARAVDGAAGWNEVATSALATAVRRDPPRGRLREAFLEDAAERLESVPPERVGPLPRPPWKLIGLAALVALLLGLMPRGGFGLLPGWGSGWGTGGRHTDGSVAWGEPTPREGKDGKEQEGGDAPDPTAEDATVPAGGGEPGPGAAPTPPPEKPEPEPETSEEPDRPEEPPPPDPPKPSPVDGLDVVPRQREFPHGVPAMVAATGTGAAAATGEESLEVRVALDGGPARSTGVRWTPRSGEPLRAILDLGARMDRAAPSPGEHTVAVELVRPDGSVAARSPARPFRVQPPPDSKPDGGGGSGGSPPPPDPPPPEPSAGPEDGGDPPPPPAPSPPDGEPAGGGEPPPPEPVPAVPPAFEDVYVVPLFGEGAETSKKGPVLVPDPEGMRGDAPRTLPPEEVLRRVEADVEDAARREGVRAGDRDLARRYFEALRALLEGGK